MVLFIFIYLLRTTTLCIYTTATRLNPALWHSIQEHLLWFTPPFFNPLPEEPFMYRSAVKKTLILASGVLYLVHLRAATFCVAALRVSLALHRKPSTTKHTDFLTLIKSRYDKIEYSFWRRIKIF